jgi:hypothetical protein
MGSHRSPEDMLASVEAGAVAEQARALAAQMNGWLKGPASGDLTITYCPAGLNSDGVGRYHEPPSDLVEWCRSARDVLEAVARG